MEKLLCFTVSQSPVEKEFYFTDTELSRSRNFIQQDHAKKSNSKGHGPHQACFTYFLTCTTLQKKIMKFQKISGPSQCHLKIELSWLELKSHLSLRKGLTLSS